MRLCLKYLYVDVLVLPTNVLTFSIPKKKSLRPSIFLGQIQRFICTYLPPSKYSGEGDKTPHGNRMVIDLFRELDEHPVEVVRNPSSPAFFAVLPTALKRAYSLVSIRRRSDDFSTLQRRGTHVRLVSTQSG